MSAMTAFVGSGADVCSVDCPTKNWRISKTNVECTSKRRSRPFGCHRAELVQARDARVELDDVRHGDLARDGIELRVNAAQRAAREKEKQAASTIGTAVDL